MAKTQTDLVNAAYAEITVSAAPPSTEDAAFIAGHVAPLVADLTARRIYVVSSPNAIAEAAFPHLVRILAERVAPSFGRPTNEDAIKAAEALLGEIARSDRTITSKLVRRVLDQLAVWQVPQSTLDAQAIAERIPEAIEDLQMREVIYFADESDIPAGALPDVARYIAAYLAPKPMGDVIADAERRLRRMASSTYVYTPARPLYF